MNNGEYSWYPDTNHGWIAEYLPKNDWAMALGFLFQHHGSHLGGKTMVNSGFNKDS